MDDFKLLNKIEDTQYGATTFLYQLPSGLKLVHTLDPKTVDTNINVLYKAGSLYEPLLDVPNGTAHLLEHLLCNPNKVFKTKRTQDSFRFGDKKKPTLRTNASTSRFTQSIWGFTNYEGELRLAKYLAAQIDNSLENIVKDLEKERKIVIAERNRYAKRTESTGLQYLEFIFKKDKSYSSHVLGEVEEISQINNDSIKKAWDRLISPNRAILTVQTHRELTTAFKKALLHIDQAINSSELSTLPDIKENFTNEYRYHHHKDTQAQGVYIEFNIFNEYDKVINYKKRAVNYLTRVLLDKVVEDEMREKRGLVYSSRGINDGGYTIHYNIVGYSFECSHDDLLTAINEFNKIMNSKAEKFINSKAGAKWLESKISDYIFPNTLEYNRNYAYELGFDILHEHELFDFEKLKEAAVKVQKDEIIANLKALYTTPMHVFMVSDKEKEKMIGLYEKSDFHKHQQSIK
ncbi:MAG: hypothetical protein Fur003_3850 [Candidatus Dojkabacteria bacterium]